MHPDRVIIANQSERIPHCLYWTAEEVCEWVHRIGMGIYEDCFRCNFITGRKLSCLYAAGLCAIGIKDFKDILYICKELRKILWVHTLDFDSIACRTTPRLMYIEQKRLTGKWIDNLTYREFLEEMAPMFDAAFPRPGQMLPPQEFLRKVDPCPWPDLKINVETKEEKPRVLKSHSTSCILCEKMKQYDPTPEMIFTFPPKNCYVDGRLLVGPCELHRSSSCAW